MTEMRDPPVIRIREDTLTHYLDVEPGLLFLACFRRDQDFRENLDRLEKVSLALGRNGITVGYVLDELLPYLADRFGIGGTPAYLAIRNGVALGTLLGKSTGPTLIGFILEAGHAGS